MASEKLTHREIRPVKQRVEDDLLARPGVVGVDINEKVTRGKPTGQLAIVVYVQHKKGKNQVPKDELIPPEIDGIPTDVKEERIELHTASVALATLAPQVDATRYATLHGGISMGPCRSVHLEPPDVDTAGDYIFVGTLGAIVRDRTTGASMALTNFHVACVDDGWTAGDAMCQPGRVDGGACPADTFGSLTRAVLSNHVDGTVVSINASETTDCSIEEIGAVRGQATAALDMAVRKRGRTTGLTYGTVNSVDASVTIDYGDGLGDHTLRNQIRITADTARSAQFSDHGDSGSVVVDGSNNVVALLFGGSTAATYANPIAFALDELGVDLCVKRQYILTRPQICDPIVTRPVICHVFTNTAICPVVTRPSICAIATAPALCRVPVTKLCPPVSLACGRPPVGGGPVAGPAGEGELDRLYGTAGAEATDDAFWLGYYTALEAVAEAEESAEG